MAKNIIIVDDEPHVLKAVEMSLMGQGYDVSTAKNADEALRMIDGETDLILLDIMMPGMRPVDLLKTLKQKKLKVKCIYLSAVTFTDEKKKEMVKDGMVEGFIQKPFEPDDLLKKIKKAIG